MENYFPEELIETVKDRNDIVEVISQYVPLKSTGMSSKGLCPFHNEKTPSFTVSKDKQFYKCFGCGEGGDVIGFIMKIENMDFIEAVKMLAQRGNIPIDESTTSEEMKKKLERQKVYFDINREAGKYFYEHLVQRKNPALNYLIKRGLTTRTIKSFGLGYAINSWDDLLNYLIQKGYKIETIEQCGLIIKNKEKNNYYNRFRNRIMFPIFDVKGNVIGFGGRVFDDSLPKYLNSPETAYFNKSQTLYGLNIASKHSRTGRVILVEGYTDVIALHQEGFKNTVATLGTSFTKGHAILLKKYFNEVIICFDGDSAGSKATLRSIEILENVHISIRVLILPNNIDPDDFIKKYGEKAFEAKIEEALSAIDYKIYLAQKQHPSGSTEDQIKLGKKIANIIREIDSPIEQEAYIKKIEEKTGISKNAIISEIYGKKTTTDKGNNTKYSSNYKRNNKYIQAVPLVEQNGHIIAGKQLIKYMLTNPPGISNILEKVEINDFILESHRIIFQYILEKHQNFDDINKIMEHFPELHEEIKDIININIQQVDIDQAIDKYKKDVKRYKLLFARNKLKEEQQDIIKKENLDKEEVEKQLLKLGVEMMNINIELQKLQSEERREQN
ncbi:DNA primase [Natronincola peptidivorans]|uniref:DNA primase n=1 Tax=Natronincola peptidivorans TaxID=426128 RepID=A0A1H9Y4F8_9FIRM|nr:DNA primase [Natronincola peptidivorans]SES63582.1 DNA primase [Natronincola peptidivorans]